LSKQTYFLEGNRLFFISILKLIDKKGSTS